MSARVTASCWQPRCCVSAPDWFPVLQQRGASTRLRRNHPDYHFTTNQRNPDMKPTLFTTLIEFFALAGLFGLIFFGWVLLAPLDPTSFTR